MSELSTTEQIELGNKPDRTTVIRQLSSSAIDHTLEAKDSTTMPDDNKESEQVEDERKAKDYYAEKLAGEDLIDVPQSSNCETAIVVPVYAEEPKRILDQIKSLLDQKDVNLSTLEVVYVVNNGEDDGSEEFQQTRQLNQAVLDLPIWANRELSPDEGSYSPEDLALFKVIREQLTVFVIDKSSPGHEIHGCNVGKARNRGLAEASFRFFANNKNGILIQTDADTTFEDKQFIKKMGEQFADSNLIGIAGGLDMVIDPDIQDSAMRERLLTNMSSAIRLRMYERLADFCRYPDYAFDSSSSFSGANMLSRSFESAVIGGFIDAPMGEDPKFGRDLKELAGRRGKEVIALKDELKLRTAIRPSERTDASLGKTIGKDFGDGKEKLVDNPEVPDKDDFRREFAQTFIESAGNVDKLKNLFTDINGEVIIPIEDIKVLGRLLSESSRPLTAENIGTYQPLVKWRDKVFGKDFDVAGLIWDKKFGNAPKIPLDDQVIETLISKAKTIEGGEKFCDALVKQVEDFKKLNGIK
jgi:glycosyltransferase involved in cell wall biosynthesis